MKFKDITSRWVRFLNEQEEDQDSSSLDGGAYDKPATPKNKPKPTQKAKPKQKKPVTTIDITVSDVVDSVSLAHTQEAMAELIWFGNGAVSENMPRSWPRISMYWHDIQSNWLANRTRLGKEYPAGRTRAECQKKGKEFFEEERRLNRKSKADEDQWRYNFGKGKVFEGAHWSAAFIQYCMKGNASFQKLDGNNRGVHGWYWAPGIKNYNTILSRLKGGDSVDEVYEGDWICFKKNVAEKIGYYPQEGDIVLTQKGTKPGHGDIVVEGSSDTFYSYRSVGGNLGPTYFGSVRYAKPRHKFLMTQNKEAYLKIMQTYGPKPQAVGGTGNQP